MQNSLLRKLTILLSLILFICSLDLKMTVMIDDAIKGIYKNGDSTNIYTGTATSACIQNISTTAVSGDIFSFKIYNSIDHVGMSGTFYFGKYALNVMSTSYHLLCESTYKAITSITRFYLSVGTQKIIGISNAACTNFTFEFRVPYIFNISTQIENSIYLGTRISSTANIDVCTKDAENSDWNTSRTFQRYNSSTSTTMKYTVSNNSLTYFLREAWIGCTDDTMTTSLPIKPTCSKKVYLLFFVKKYGQSCTFDSSTEPYGAFSCTNACISGYYDTSTTSTVFCKKCGNTCSKCETKENNCLACKYGYYFNTSSSSGNCLLGTGTYLNYYLDKSSSPYLFQKCDSSCKYCKGSSDNCNECSNGYFPLEDNATKCVNETSKPTNYYLDENIYRKCISNCSKCRTSNETCTACSSGYYGYLFNENEEEDSDLRYCYINGKQPSNLYLDLTNSSNKVFKECDVSCLTCRTTKGRCLTCNNAEGYYYNKTNTSNCVNELTKASNYFLDQTDPDDIKYSPCDVSCLTCQDTNGQCLSCNNAGGYFYNVSNISNCLNASTKESNYYFDETNSDDKKYMPCDQSCLSCQTTSGKCLTCNNEGGYFYNVSNITNCLNESTKESNYYLDETNIDDKKYMECDESCLTCQTTKGQCGTCNNEGGYFYNISNTSNCLNEDTKEGNYFLDQSDPSDKNYKKCDISCLTCQNSLKECMTCNNPELYYYNALNTSSCLNEETKESNFYLDQTNLDDIKYQQCDTSCLTCKNTNGQCLTCNNAGGYYYNKTNTSNCLNESTKASNYFLDQSNDDNKNYQQCDISCLTCQTSKKNCLSCNNEGGYYYYKLNTSSCLNEDTKESNYYLDQTDLTDIHYQNCDVSCLTCQNTEKECLTCNNIGGYYYNKLNSSSCLNEDTKESNFYLDKTNVSDINYQKCDASCLTCKTTKGQCLTCNNVGGYYYNKLNTSNCLNESTKESNFYLDQTNPLDVNYQQCDISCLTCQTTNGHCLSCNNAGGYYYNVSNTSNCLNEDTKKYNYYLDKSDPSDISYKKCDSSCNKCQNSSTTCLECASNYYPLQSNMNDCRNDETKPSDYFLDQDEIYKKCSEECQQCTEKKVCKICTEGYLPFYFLGAESNLKYCYNETTVPSSFMKVNDEVRGELVYQGCDVSCNGCGSNPSDCDACASLYFPLSDNSRSCKNEEPVGYYFDTNIYRKCDVQCKNCKNQANICLSCTDTYFPYYFDSTDNTKMYCFNELTKDTNMFLDQTTSKYVYKLCDSSCLTCHENSQKCYSCSTSYYPFELNNEQCLNESTKEENYFLDTNIYRVCDSSCKKCQTSASYCTECSDYHYFVEDQPGACKNDENIGTGYYLGESSGKKIYKRCSSECQECSGTSNYCTQCSLNYYFVEDQPGACKNNTNIGTGYYLGSVGGVQIFKRCSIQCEACSTSSSYCTICSDEYYFVEDQEGECKNEETIEEGYYLGNNAGVTMYLKCSAECKKCSTSANYCTKCSDNYYFVEDQDGTCKNSLNIEEGYYLGTRNNEQMYLKCSQECESCITSSNYCTRCSSEYYFVVDQEGACRNEETIEDGYYLGTRNNEQWYLKCNTECKKCAESSNNCIECSDNYYFVEDQEGVCKNNENIEEGYYLGTRNNEQWYLKCSPECKKCTGNANYCNECSENYYFVEDQEGSCKNDENIGDGYYLGTKNGAAMYLKCGRQCAKCIDNKDKCITCATGFYNVENRANTCKNNETIEAGYYLDNNNGDQIYKECSIECLECSINKTHCTKCSNNYYFVENIPNICKNMSTIYSGYYLGTKNTETMFLKCGTECKECFANKKNCTICSDGYHFFGKNSKFGECTNKSENINIDVIISNDSTIYTYPTDIVENQNTYNSSNVDSDKLNEIINSNNLINLGECEDKLRDHYFISDEQKIFINQTLTKQSELISYNNEFTILSDEGVELNKIYCNDSEIIINSAFSDIDTKNYPLLSDLFDKGYNVFDGNDKLFNDKCLHYDMNKKDMTLSDKRKYFYVKENQCMDYCEMKSINISDNLIVCSCKIGDKSKNGENNKDTLTNFFTNNLEKNNFYVFGCLTKIETSSLANIGLFIYLPIILLFIGLTAYHFIRLKKSEKMLKFGDTQVVSYIKPNPIRKTNNINQEYDVEIYESSKIISSQKVNKIYEEKKIDEPISNNVLASKPQQKEVNGNISSNYESYAAYFNQNKFSLKYIILLCTKKNLLTIILARHDYTLPLYLGFENLLMNISAIIFGNLFFLTSKRISKRFNSTKKIDFVYLLCNEVPVVIFSLIYVLIANKIYNTILLISYKLESGMMANKSFGQNKIKRSYYILIISKYILAYIFLLVYLWFACSFCGIYSFAPKTITFGLVFTLILFYLDKFIFITLAGVLVYSGVKKNIK